MSPSPTVRAIIATYNEEDVIAVVLKDLLDQGIHVHLLDQGSTDGTLAEAERFLTDGRLSIERMEGGEFSLARIVRRKEILASELEADWFINADADEFRESPWPGVGFVDALREVDRLGYNAVDFAVLNFLPVDDTFQKGRDPREALRFYEPGRIFDRLQVRCWKKQPGPLDLVSTAGHEARFPGRRVFPLRFLLRHYPIRGQKHGERKVFRERLPRFAADERSRGWHVQYDDVKEGQSFLREPSSLTPFDPWGTRVEVALRHREVDALEEDLALRRGELAELQAELTSVREAGRIEASALRGELERRLAELVQRMGELAALREESAARAAAARRELDDVGRERDDLLRKQREATLALEHLRMTLATEAEAGARRQAVLQYRLDMVLGSRIWKWTSPLRALLDRVFGA